MRIILMPEFLFNLFSIHNLQSILLKVVAKTNEIVKATRLSKYFCVITNKIKSNRYVT